MKKIRQIQFHAGSQEELLPDFGMDFPYIASRAELDQYPDHFVPWHWHKAVELFMWKAGKWSTISLVGKSVFQQAAADF